MEEQKRRLRKSLLRARKEYDLAQLRKKQSDLDTNLCDFLRNYLNFKEKSSISSLIYPKKSTTSTVAVYEPFGREPVVSKTMELLLSHKFRLLLPYLGSAQVAPLGLTDTGAAASTNFDHSSKSPECLDQVNYRESPHWYELAPTIPRINHLDSNLNPSADGNAGQKSTSTPGSAATDTSRINREAAQKAAPRAHTVYLPKELATAQVVIVPALACSRDGVRLGRGGGWYDRALEYATASCLLVALVYDFELLPPGALPEEPHDRRISVVVTDREVHWVS